jgi:hypothetical protein
LRSVHRSQHLVNVTVWTMLMFYDYDTG